MSIVISNAFMVIEGRPVTSSRIVAEYFGKQHKDTLRAIRDLIADAPELERKRNFALTEEEQKIGATTRKVPLYWMDQKGFCILAMGFTGAKALEFKCAFYDEFERMKNELEVPTTITPDEQLAIQLAVSHRAQKTSKHFQTIYRAIKVRYQIAKYDQLPRAQFEDCLRFIESVELSVPAKPAAPELPDDKILVSRDFLERLRVFVYYWRYLFRDDLERVHGLMESLHSPLAPHFWEAVHNLNLSIVECDLEKLGYPVKELKCYKYWLAHQGA